MLAAQATARGMAMPGVRACGPVHGPYAETWYDQADQVYRVRLTEDGKARVGDYLLRYPNPIALLISLWPATYRAARAAHFSEEEINALCLEGVAMAFVRYDPTRGAAIGTAIAWSIRAAVGTALRQASRATSHIESGQIPLASQVENGAECRGQEVLGNVCSPTMESEHAEDLHHYLALVNLSANERYVLMLRFGLANGLPLSNAAVGWAMGLSAERIRQLLDRAIRKIRAGIGLDIDWMTVARSRILTYLSSLPLSSSKERAKSGTRTRAGASKAEICKGSKVPKWQFREVMARLLRDGLVRRERVAVSRERWRIEYCVRSNPAVAKKTIP